MTLGGKTREEEKNGESFAYRQAVGLQHQPSKLQRLLGAKASWDVRLVVKCEDSAGTLLKRLGGGKDLEVGRATG